MEILRRLPQEASIQNVLPTPTDLQVMVWEFVVWGLETRVITMKVSIPIDSGLIFPFAGSVLVCEREQLLL